jgi:hypothetical protein
MPRCCCSVFVLIVASGYSLGQQDLSSVEIKSTPVAGKVYMLEGRGGNIGVSVGSDGILIVGDQFAPLDFPSFFIRSDSRGRKG